MAVMTVDTILKEESIYKTLIVGAKGRSPKTKSEDDGGLDDDTPVRPGKAGKDEDDDNEVDEKEDDWNKGEEGDSWDPDFEEFDLPKSKGKKAAGTSKGGGEEEEDFKVDEEFKDLFAGGSADDDEDEDF